MTGKVCGTCYYGAEAYDRFGRVDPNYVICQIKEAENRMRKPDRYQTLSAVSRMHYQRESCHHWEPEQEILTSVSAYDEPERHETPLNTYSPPVSISEPASSGANEALLNQLKLDVIQKDQMIQSLQFQNTHLSEELSACKEKLDDLEHKLKHAIYFDPSMTDGEVNYFELLGVSLKDTPDEIKQAYYLKIKKFHPDRFVMLTQQLNVAYETLTDPQKRQDYLSRLKQKPMPPRI